MQNMMIGVDLAKNVFQVHGASQTGEVLYRKKLSRQFSAFMALQEPSLVTFEACGSAHYWARISENTFILLDAKQMKIPSDKLVEAMCVHAQAWRAKFALVEEANHARDLIRDLKVKAQGHTIVKGVPHRNHSKEDRLLQVLYAINAGQVRLLEGEKSLDLLLHQLRQFPNGKHDDLVDSFTQALHILPRLGSGKAVWRIS